MKRVIFKFATLLVLVTAGIFIQNDSSATAATSCWETAYNKWMACDNAYSNTVGQYADINNYCANNSANNCSASAGNYCSAQASTACANDPNYQTCYNNSYSSCYLSNYQSCHTQTTTQCEGNVEDSYDNRGSAYGSCLGFEGNGNNCVEQIDGSCQQARNRAASCSSLYSGSEDTEAYSTCLANSGISQCE